MFMGFVLPQLDIIPFFNDERDMKFKIFTLNL